MFVSTYNQHLDGLALASDRPLRGTRSRAHFFSLLQGRPRPEDVLGMSNDILGLLSQKTQKKIVTPRSPYENWRYSLMLNEFKKVIVPAIFSTIVDLCPSLYLADIRDPSMIRIELEKAVDYLRDETLGRRQKNKIKRVLRLANYRIDEYERQLNLAYLTRFAETAFAPDITFETFNHDCHAWAFTLYMTARLGVRSKFTNKSQTGAFDEIAKEILDRCIEDRRTNWFCIAHVLPRPDILGRLSDDEVLHLLGLTYHVLNLCAGELRTTWNKSQFNMAKMIVHKGDDSSTWNALAGAWNRARDFWIALTNRLTDGSLLDTYLPGKVMRLMAADVVVWHDYTKKGSAGTDGASLHPDTRVWADLPTPWDVLLGTQSCDRDLVERACRKHGVHPIESGWSAPRSGRRIERWAPTPELVHGVTVSSPELALLFRKNGVFK